MSASQKSPSAFLTIGELAESLGLPQHILRYWETRFKQLKPLQRAGNRRYYRPEDAALARSLAEQIARPHFRPYISNDVIGAEIGGAVKNVLAIACGVVAGRNLGQNAGAALIARGFAEMVRFGLARGAQAETLSGLSGLGDLVLTCSSISSRNFSLGKGLGEGKQARDLLAASPAIAEGVYTAPVLNEAAKAVGVDMPVTAAVCALLSGDADVGEIVHALLSRPLRTEV